MRKTITALAASAAFASPPAFAQSNVTIFGIVDLALRITQTEGMPSLKSLASSGASGSRLGFRGIEDLGGGLQAGFWIESDIFPDTGASDTTKFWGRRSTLSLASSTLGELRVGRDYVPIFILQQPVFDPFNNSGVGGNGNFFYSVPSRLGSGSSAWLRADNMVKYVLPAGLGGVYGEFALSLGEGTNSNRHRGGVLGYASGPLRVTIGFGHTDDTAGVDKLKLSNVAGAYDFGVLRVMAQYQQGRYQARRQNTLQLAATAPIGNGLVKASCLRADQSGALTDANDAHQLALGYSHWLSKRTTLYGTLARIDNKGMQAFGIGANAVGAAAGKRLTGAEVGINHSF